MTGLDVGVKYVCKICDRDMSNTKNPEINLRAHKQNFHSVKPFKVQLFDESVVELIRSSEKMPITCPTCNVPFMDQTYIKKHTRTCHRIQKPVDVENKPREISIAFHFWLLI